MRIEQLSYLLAIKHFHSMSLAGESLYVSQQAVSLAIKQLEEECGVQLVKRTNKGSFLTSYGEEVVLYAQDIFEKWTLLINHFKDSASSLSTKCSLLMTHNFSINPYTIKLISQLHSTIPQLELNIDYLSSGEIIPQTLINPFSIGICMLHSHDYNQLTDCYKIILDTHYVSICAKINSNLLSQGHISLKSLRHQKIFCMHENNPETNPLISVIAKYRLEEYNHFVYNVPSAAYDDYLANDYIMIGLYSKKNISLSPTNNTSIKLIADEQINLHSIACTCSKELFDIVKVALITND